jgi:ABC-type multidrug transport system fused ATPase/permease subunit
MLSERRLQETIAEMRDTCSVVIVAHRPATIQMCDRVLRVSEGQVVELERAPVAHDAGP